MKTNELILVEEHLNSNNSPFRFNAKELDQETGNYYYGARYGVYPEHSRRDPKFSIWISVDPLAELMPEWSSYAYTYNNPVNYIDPDGRAPFDHYFSRDGRYLGSDNRLTNDIRVMQSNYGIDIFSLTLLDYEYAYNNSTTLSSFNYTFTENINMLKKIASYYQEQVGLSANGKMGVRNREESVMHVVGNGPKINISIRDNGTSISQLLDNAFNFMNAIVHEDGHRRDGNPTNFEHTSNYLDQTKHSTWTETTSDFQIHMGKKVEELLNNALVKDQISKQLIKNRISEFNNVILGINLIFNEENNCVEFKPNEYLDNVTIQN